MMMAGLLLARLRRQKRLGFVLFMAGWCWLFVMSLPITSIFLGQSLEQMAGPYANPEDLSRAGVAHIAILAATSVESGLSPADRWGAVGLLRLMEGIRLFQALPGTTLLISGGSFRERQSSAESMAELPVVLGIPREALIIETRGRDTEHECRLFAQVVGNSPFALVTSALHMPRSIEILRDLGLEPIPCPCDFRSFRNSERVRWYLPSAIALRETTLAIHEYLGIAWHRAGRIIGERRL